MVFHPGKGREKPLQPGRKSGSAAPRRRPSPPHPRLRSGQSPRNTWSIRWISNPSGHPNRRNARIVRPHAQQRKRSCRFSERQVRPLRQTQHSTGPLPSSAACRGCRFEKSVSVRKADEPSMLSVAGPARPNVSSNRSIVSATGMHPAAGRMPCRRSSSSQCSAIMYPNSFRRTQSARKVRMNRGKAETGSPFRSKADRRSPPAAGKAAVLYGRSPEPHGKQGGSRNECGMPFGRFRPQRRNEERLRTLRSQGGRQLRHDTAQLTLAVAEGSRIEGRLGRMAVVAAAGLQALVRRTGFMPAVAAAHLLRGRRRRRGHALARKRETCRPARHEQVDAQQPERYEPFRFHSLQHFFRTNVRPDAKV